MKGLAKALQKERQRRDLTLRGAARELKVAVGTYEGWEHGWRLPDTKNVETLQRLAAWLEVPQPVILGWLGLLTDEQVVALVGDSINPGYLKQLVGAGILPAGMLISSAA